MMTAEEEEKVVQKVRSEKAVSWPAFWAEFVAMTLFVVIGCGSAMGVAGSEGWLLQVSLTFGLAITSLAYSVGHISGGHINCAVTLGLVLTGNCEPQQGLANFFAQVLGSISGAGLLFLVHPAARDRTRSLGSNTLNKQHFHWHNALIGEIAMTFLLVYVVLETACNPNSAANRSQACIAIGFAVFLAHTVLIPIDGCSINPTRSLGPAILAQARYPEVQPFEHMWVFWVGPLLGSVAAAGCYHWVRWIPTSLDVAALSEAKLAEEKASHKACDEPGSKWPAGEAVDLDEVVLENLGEDEDRHEAERQDEEPNEDTALAVGGDDDHELEVPPPPSPRRPSGSAPPPPPPRLSGSSRSASAALGAEAVGGSTSCCLVFKGLVA